jgi:hypothetical protein
VYHRLLAADPQKQDELLRDFFRSLTTDLERIQELCRLAPMSAHTFQKVKKGS